MFEPSLLDTKLKRSRIKVHSPVHRLQKQIKRNDKGIGEKQSKEEKQSSDQQARNTFLIISKNFLVRRPREESNREFLSSVASLAEACRFGAAAGAEPMIVNKYDK